MKTDNRGLYRQTFTYDGKRYTCWGKTQREAVLKAEERKRALADGELNGNTTVSKWADAWINTYIKPKVRKAGQDKMPGTMSPKSFTMYEHMLQNYILPDIGSMKLAKVRDVHLQAILNDSAGRSKSHISKLKIVIQAMFAQANNSRIIPYNPAVGLVLPNYTEGKRRSITDSERNAIMSSQNGFLARFILMTGIRPSELKCLRFCHIDRQKNTIHICQAVESGTDIISTPKSSAGDRYVPLRPELADELHGASDPFAFVFTKDGKMLNDWDLRTYWKQLSKECGLASDLTLYCLRHTYCTDLQKSGIDIDTARYLMGHSDIAVTASIYTHSGEHTAILALEKMLCDKNCDTGKTKKA